jgi:5-methyltetrahydropteroyltriglutamate--homocysteine methyltransferase
LRTSTDRIITTHVGSLPAPPDLWNLAGVDSSRLSRAVGEVVQHQRDCGVDIVNEGEITKGGSWVVFVNERLTGFEPSATGSVASLLTSSRD